jgi:hypothetical protein
MIDANQVPLISDISRGLVEEIAPQELPLFRITSKVYFEEPEKVFEDRKHHDNVLAIGLGDTITFLTPVVLAITTQVIKFLAEKAQKSIQEQSEEIIAKFVKSMFKRISPKEEEKEVSLKLSREELIELRKLMLETAKQLRLPEDRTDLLVNAMVGRLAITNI